MIQIQIISAEKENYNCYHQLSNKLQQSRASSRREVVTKNSRWSQGKAVQPTTARRNDFFEELANSAKEGRKLEGNMLREVRSLPLSLSFSRAGINLCTTSKLRLMSYHMEDDVSWWHIDVVLPDKRCNWDPRSSEQQYSNNKRWSIILSSLFNYIYVSYSRVHPRHMYSVIEKLVQGLDFFLEMSCVPPGATWNNFTRSRARNPLLGIDYSFETSFTSW